MLNFKTILAGSVAALIAGTALTPAMAAPGFAGKSGKQMSSRFFETYDTNNDGVVTTADIETKRKADFTKADTNGDGTISLEEWKVFAAERAAERGKDRTVRMFQRFDTNGDGQVTREDFLAQAERMTARMDKMQQRKSERMAKMRDGKGPNSEGKQGKGSWNDGPRKQGMMAGKHHGKGMRGEMMRGMFAQVDLDSDGKISQEELGKLADKLFANGPLDLDGFRAVTAEFREPMYVRSFQRLDTNGDLKINFDEFMAPTAKMIQRLDRNHDGVITKADFQKMRKDWRKGHKGQKGGRGDQGQGPRAQ
ncbi:hypothetical protein GCM10007094_04870 [Pseudovibrio japonicus]|uniref:EF-hand domain-containing protein n=1 Tax=Pseudovibrio japonicus TaxID=366534 RepID=A0ABQ3E3H3_9HYPH|nr:EF-hand domain-containing protein [Pseudovibrio japonicus]GHB19945.1 hypothetical protein GCM10007094_04870 [Pseudovibrio japonicus]